MSTVKHAIEEHDVVALREPIGTWPAGTTGTVVSLYEGSALVEVAATHLARHSTTFSPSPSSSSSCAGVTAPVGSRAWKPDGSPSRRDLTCRRSTALA